MVWAKFKNRIREKFRVHTGAYGGGSQVKEEFLFRLLSE